LRHAKAHYAYDAVNVLLKESEMMVAAGDDIGGKQHA